MHNISTAEILLWLSSMSSDFKKYLLPKVKVISSLDGLPVIDGCPLNYGKFRVTNLCNLYEQNIMTPLLPSETFPNSIYK